MILAFTLVTNTNSTLNTYILIVIHTQTIFNTYTLLKKFKNDTLKHEISSVSTYKKGKLI